MQWSQSVIADNRPGGNAFIAAAMLANAPAVIDVIAGRVDLIFDGMAAWLPNVKAGELRALAVTTAKRAAAMPDLPDLPTVAEAGLPGFDLGSWFGLLAPAATPAAVINKLNEAVVAILRDPEVTRLLTGLGREPAPSTPEEFARCIRAEPVKWTRVIKDANSRME